jgi:hypothetical protein
MERFRRSVKEKCVERMIFLGEEGAAIGRNLIP